MSEQKRSKSPNYAIINRKKIYPVTSVSNFVSSLEDYKGLLIAMNSEKILHEDKALNNLINQSRTYPDGIGAVLALKKAGIYSIRMPGVELWLHLLDKFHAKKSLYLIGSKQEVISKSIEKIKELYPDLNIVGYRDGYFKSEEEDKLIEDIQLKKPDLVFVAMGSPRQEYFMESANRTHNALYLGLGGSLDVFIGNKKRAPYLFQRIGLEWLFRLIIEPSRVFRQTKLIRFIYLLIFDSSFIQSQ